jgi:hypothetical protein
MRVKLLDKKKLESRLSEQMRYIVVAGRTPAVQRQSTTLRCCSTPSVHLNYTQPAHQLTCLLANIHHQVK